MATSQSLASIMEKMVAKVMEDAVSTSIIYTQAPHNEGEKVITKEESPSVTNAGDPSGSSFRDDASNQQKYVRLNRYEAATSVAPLHQTRRRLFNVPPIMQLATTVEQTRLGEEIANTMATEEHDVEAEVAGAFNSCNLVELLLEELLLSVVENKMLDDASSDFFSQDSPPQHLGPCSQDFAFFKAIAQTREDLTTEEEESSENELSPPSQLVNSPSTSQLGDLMGLASQEDFFSSPEGAPALKRQKTLTIEEDIVIEMMANGRPGIDYVDVEVSEGNRSSEDEEEATPLTFHTKEDLIRKLQGIHRLSRGNEGSPREPLQSTRMTGFDGEGNEQLTMMESSSEVALEKRGRRHKRTAMRGQKEACLEDVVMKKEQLCKMEEQVEFGRGGSKDKIFAMEGDEESLRQDSDEDISTMESKSKQKDFGLEDGIVVKSYQPLALLLNRAPRLGLSRLQKPSGIHDITIIKDVSFNKDYDYDDVSFIKEE